MRRSLGVLVLLLLACGLSAEASAAYLVTTYDAFDPVVQALTRAALIFSDNSFTSTAYAFGMAGLVVGALMVITSISQGRPVSPISFAVPFVLGAAILTAILAPKEDVIVHDNTTGETTTVAAFPAGLGQTLAWLSEARDQVINLIDTSAPPGPPQIWSYAANVNGLSFDVLMRLLLNMDYISDNYLDSSLDAYIENCMSWALAVPGGVNWDDLNSGNVDMMDNYAKGVPASIEVMYYDAAHPSGMVTNCKQDWEQYLQPALSGAAAQDMFKKTILAACEEHGIRTSLRAATASSGSSLSGGPDTRCLDSFAWSVTAAIGETNSPPWTVSGATAWQWARHIYLAHKLTKWASEASPTALGNYQQIIDRVGWVGQASQWLPIIRAWLLAISIAIVPFSLLFVLTGAGHRALFFPLGMVLFVFVWEIMDAMTHGFMMEAAFRAFADATQHQIGLIGLAKLAPESVKLMSAIGTIKVTAAVLASSFMYVVFRYGGMAAAMLANSFAESAKQYGSDSMRKSAEPIQHAQWLQALANSEATQWANKAVGGFENYATAGAYGASSSTVANYTASQNLGTNPASAGAAAGAVKGGGEAGQVMAAKQVGMATGMSPTAAAMQGAFGNSASRTASGVGASRAYGDMLSQGGNPLGDAMQAGKYDFGAQVGKGQGATSAGHGDAAGVGKNVGMITTMQGAAAAEVARIMASAAGSSLMDGIRGQAGANRQISLTGEQMGHAIDEAKSHGFLQNLDPQLEQQLRNEGGVASISFASEGGGYTPASVSVGLKDSGSYDGSSSLNMSKVFDSQVRASTGVSTSGMDAANNPWTQSAANAELYQELSNALASGDHDRVAGALLNIGKYAQELKGVSSQATVSDSFGAGPSGQAQASYGKRAGNFKGGMGIDYTMSDSRQEQGTAQGEGVYDLAQSLANTLQQNYDTSINHLGRSHSAAAREAYEDALHHMGGFADAMARQVSQAAEYQVESMRENSVGQATRNLAVEGTREAVDAAKNVYDEAVHWTTDRFEDIANGIDEVKGVWDNWTGGDNDKKD